MVGYLKDEEGRQSYSCIPCRGFLKFLYSEPVITKEKNGAKDTMTLLQITIKYIGSSIYYKWQKILNFPWFFAYDIQFIGLIKLKEIR